MLTRAKVIEKSSNGKWMINIPILNGIPNNKDEATTLKEIYDNAVKINSKKEESKREKPHAIVSQSYEAWDKRLDKFYGYGNNGDKEESWNLTNNMAEFLMEASVCNIGGVSDIIHENDIVIVGFEDNDMGKPIILGHLLTSTLEKNRLEYPNYKVNSLYVNGDSLTIPKATSFKDSELSLSNILEMYEWYKSVIESFPGNELVSSLQSFKSILNNLPGISTNDNTNSGEEKI